MEDDTHNANDYKKQCLMSEMICYKRAKLSSLEGKEERTGAMYCLVLGDGWPAMNPHTVDACARLLGFLSLKLYYLICLHESGGADLYSDVVLCRTLVSPQFCLALLLDMERQFVCGRERESYIDRTQSTSKAC